MPDGGFLVKFNNKKAVRCYSIAVNYDKWEYKVNGKTKKNLPAKLKSITIKVEEKD